MVNPSPKSELTRAKLLPKLAAHVLASGIDGASLRPLAEAAGTSDRMLIYHFGSKEALVEQVLAFIADTYAARLDAAFDGQRATSREACIERILAFTRQEAMKPFLALWWQIVAGAARGKAGYRESAQAIMDTLLEWLETQMPPGDPDPVGGARTLLTLIEGAEMFATIGREEIALQGIAAARPL